MASGSTINYAAIILKFMTQDKNSKGFGAPMEAPPPRRKKRKPMMMPRLSDEDFQAKKQLEASDGPIFEIFARPQGSSVDWKALGKVGSKTSIGVNKAIFEMEEKLYQNALVLDKTWRKEKPLMEYSFRNVEFPDDPYTPAVRPLKMPSFLENLKGFLGNKKAK
jgi:Family of unknown function (DUF6523)